MAVPFPRARWGVRLLNSLAPTLALVFLLLGPTRTAARQFSTVVIDAGHGGFDRGGIPGQRVPEKVMALDVAQRLAKDLQRAGYHVVMTRDSDVFVTLGDRVRIANRYRNAVFVCIHFNSATREGANGIETYYYNNDSAALAADIHRQVVSGTTTDNRGIRRRGYFVLRRTSIPAVLVECGFLTNRDEAHLVLQGSYRQRLADRIADGIEGKRPAFYRPVVPGLSHVTSPIHDRYNYNDFVAAVPERHSRTKHHTTHHTRRSTHSSRHPHSSSSSKKKKSSSSSSKKKSSSSSSKKKKKKHSDDD